MVSPSYTRRFHQEFLEPRKPNPAFGGIAERQDRPPSPWWFPDPRISRISHEQAMEQLNTRLAEETVSPNGLIGLTIRFLRSISQTTESLATRIEAPIKLERYR
jgi:hypothetical protein